MFDMVALSRAGILQQLSRVGKKTTPSAELGWEVVNEEPLSQGDP